MSGILFSFSLIFFLENFKLLLLIKVLLIKRRVNSNINASQSIPLANKTVSLFLGLHVQNNIIQNNLCAKPNHKIVYCSLKSMLLRGIRARGATKYENFDNFLKIGKHLEKEKVKLSDLKSKFIFFRIECMFCKLFPKNTNQYPHYLFSSFSIYLHSVFIISIFRIYLHSLLDK